MSPQFRTPDISGHKLTAKVWAIQQKEVDSTDEKIEIRMLLTIREKEFTVELFGVVASSNEEPRVPKASECIRHRPSSAEERANTARKKDGSPSMVKPNFLTFYEVLYNLHS